MVPSRFLTKSLNQSERITVASKPIIRGMEPKRVQIESFWTSHSGWLCFAIVVLVSVVGYLLDRLLVHEGVSRTYMLMVSNTITGVVAGGLFFQIVRHERARRELVRERMKTIAELNHHIRNALQVIKLCGAQPASGIDAKPLQLIKESVDRIEWALREVLPKYPADEGNATRQPPTGYGVAPSVQRIAAFSEEGQPTEPR